MSAFTYYNILRVRPDASTEQIKTAYRRAQAETHPDRSGVDNSELSTLITDAYSTLVNEAKRAAYDRSLASPAPEYTLNEPNMSEQTFAEPTFDAPPAWAQEHFDAGPSHGSDDNPDLGDYYRAQSDAAFKNMHDINRRIREDRARQDQQSGTRTQDASGTQRYEAKPLSFFQRKVRKFAYLFLTLAIFFYFLPLVLSMTLNGTPDTSPLILASLMGATGVLGHLILLLPTARGSEHHQGKLITYVVLSALIILFAVGLSPGFGIVLAVEAVCAIGAAVGMRYRKLGLSITPPIKSGACH